MRFMQREDKLFDRLFLDFHWGHFLAAKGQFILWIFVTLEIYKVSRIWQPVAAFVGFCLVMLAGRIFRRSGRAAQFTSRQYEGLGNSIIERMNDNSL